MSDNVIVFKAKDNKNPDYDRNFFTNLSIIVNQIYTKCKHKSVGEKVLKKEFDRIIDQAKNSKWLSSEDLSIYLKQIEKFMMKNGDNDINKIFDVMTYTCLIDKRKESLYDEYNMTEDIVDALVESDLPYTNYKIYADVLYSKEFNEIFDRKEDKIPPFRRIQTIIDDIELKREDTYEINLHKVLNYVNEDKVVIVYEKDFQAIYSYLFEQMRRINDFCPDFFSDDYFTRLNRIKKLVHLQEDKKDEVLEKFHTIHKQPIDIKSEVISTLALTDLVIDTYIIEDNIIRPNFNKA